MKRFRIYYGDGSTFAGDPFYAPTANAMAVVVEDGDGVSVRTAKDYYCWKNDTGWFACDIGGMWDYLLMYEGPKAVLIGRYIRNEEYWAVCARAAKEGLG